MPFFAASEAPPRPESMKFPVFSLLAGNLAFSETSSQLTPPSRRESTANLTADDELRCLALFDPLAHPGGVDARIDDQMGDVDALRAELACGALRHRAHNGAWSCSAAVWPG